MDKFEVAATAAVLVGVLAFFGFLGYWTHEENMACIKVGGQMVDRQCKRAALKEGD